MYSLRYRCVVILLLLTLTGCANLPVRFGSTQGSGTPVLGGMVSPAAPTPTRTEGTTVSRTLVPALTSTPQPLESAQVAPGTLIRVWLPPEFDPEKDSPANTLLKARLERFEAEHPEVKLEVRIKDLDGPGGLLDSLAAASVSAPLVLPDLVLLPRPMLESAALKGLLTPLDGLTDAMDDPSWFGYAQQLAHLKASTYGLPFAGDAMVLAYKPSLTGVVPHTLEALIALGGVMLFPAADPQALLTLGTYLDGGGSLQDDQGRPFLDQTILTNVLEFDQRASLAGVMPFWMTQYADDDQVWEAFTGDQFPMAVTWASIYMKNIQDIPDDLAMSPLPSWDGSPFTLANGWSWALAGQDPERHPLSLRLAEFMVDKEFVAAWTLAAGYLPPRVDALQSWTGADLRQAVEQISYSAQLIPPADLVSSLGAELSQAVVVVLKAESEPQTAAQAVTDQVNQP
jgi:multiple sugar transport system substrate-binding protein